MSYHDNSSSTDFDAIHLGVASPETIHEWSHGEVTKPETINYRTQKPERDGLFCERTFGPTKDWECYCGKYKRIRYKGIICDKCGVEVTRSLVRRERMGHIDLAAPVSHIWFLRGVPSKIGLMLDLSIQDLEKVIYFANFIVTAVNTQLRDSALAQIQEEYKEKKRELDTEAQQMMQEIKKREVELIAESTTDGQKKKAHDNIEQEMVNASVNRDEALKELQDAVDVATNELKELEKYQIISEQKYQDLSLKYGHVFEAGIGAEAIRALLAEIDLAATVKKLDEELADSSKNKQRRLYRRLKLMKNFVKNQIKPEWMIMTVVPVIPPDLRPMVQLDGGRFAASDLNDLYRRVINRNNRLKKLIELNAPEVIQRNEKRMLQEAVDALIDNGARHGKTVTAASGQRRQLKSLADMLKGKQGRFRQNLLGKRVDYSGRSVIVVGPHLKLDQCGLPKKMALELFKPFVISKLIERDYVHNVRSATRFIDSERAEVWDILEEVTADSYVLLNRAPTLHRLGIQAFRPVLIEGKAIQIHPLVCTAFNADFDGDQMAVHVPLTQKAQWEARNIMLSTNNILKPATGEPVVSPSQDIVLGAYYLTQIQPPKDGKSVPAFIDRNEAKMAYHHGKITLQDTIHVEMNGVVMQTSVGRIIFNQILPEGFEFLNLVMDRGTIRTVISKVLHNYGREETVKLLDRIKELSFEYLTQSGLSWGMDDLLVPDEKKGIVEKADAEVDAMMSQYEMGLLTDEERHVRVTEIWSKTKNEITAIAQEQLDRSGPVFPMIESGARGSWAQLSQIVGMRGLVTNPAGDIIELPVKGNLKEGLDVLEYFISTHGTRKGLSDTALRTASAGYLTRRLVDVAQDVIISTNDCGDTEGITWNASENDSVGVSLAARTFGRTLLEDVKDAKGKVVVKKGIIVAQAEVDAMDKAEITDVRIRSLLTCKATRGVCQKCYGFDLGYNELVELGVAVGIIAAQSIGEPGTQLTMRTFHTGGVVGTDITQGLPRVEELFEARPVKKPAVLATVDGKVSIIDDGTQKTIRITHTENVYEQYRLIKSGEVKVKNGQEVQSGDVLMSSKSGKNIVAKNSGVVNVTDKEINILRQENIAEDLPILGPYTILVSDGDLVTKGQVLTEGNINLHELFAWQSKSAVQKYIMHQIQYIYSSQGQKLNDKHLEIIVRQMFSRFMVEEAGDTNLLEGDVVSAYQLTMANEKAKANKGKPAKVEQLLVGITKASLSTESFLSAASFQETPRILIDAAVSGKIDPLRGLKENVIIGRIIPVGTGFGPRALQLQEEVDVIIAEREAKRDALRAEAESLNNAEYADAETLVASPEDATAPPAEELATEEPAE